MKRAVLLIGFVGCFMLAALPAQASGPYVTQTLASGDNGWGNGSHNESVIADESGTFDLVATAEDHTPAITYNRPAESDIETYFSQAFTGLPPGKYAATVTIWLSDASVSANPIGQGAALIGYSVGCDWSTCGYNEAPDTHIVSTDWGSPRTASDRTLRTVITFTKTTADRVGVTVRTSVNARSGSGVYFDSTPVGHGVQYGRAQTTLRGSIKSIAISPVT
jgi:hypothetical protein